jgi:hypothetical protein
VVYKVDRLTRSLADFAKLARLSRELAIARSSLPNASSPVGITLGAIGVVAITAGNGIFRIELHCLVVVGNSPTVILLGGVDAAAVAIG